jgi:hypothetical protein
MDSTTTPTPTATTRETTTRHAHHQPSALLVPPRRDASDPEAARGPRAAPATPQPMCFPPRWDASDPEEAQGSSALHTLLSFGFPAKPSGALQHEEIVDVELVGKIEQLSDAVRAPMAFFNLWGI